MTSVSPLRRRALVDARRVTKLGTPSTWLAKSGWLTSGRDGEDDVALVGHARHEVHQRAERLELHVGREARHDADRDLAAHLEDRGLAAHGEDLRLRQDGRQPLASAAP